MKLTVIGPRMDMGDAHRNRVQDFTRAHMGPVEYRTGWYPHRGGWDGAWSMSRAINAGRRGVTTPGLLLTPTDYIIPPEVIARCEAVLDEHAVVGTVPQCAADIPIGHAPHPRRAP